MIDDIEAARALIRSQSVAFHQDLDDLRTREDALVDLLTQFAEAIRALDPGAEHIAAARRTTWPPAKGETA